MGTGNWILEPESWGTESRLIEKFLSPQTSASATLARLPHPHSPSEPRRNKWNQFTSTRRTRSFHQIRIDHGPSPSSRRIGVRSQRHEGILERTATQTTRCFFIPNATIYANCPQQRTLVQGKLTDTPISEYPNRIPTSRQAQHIEPPSCHPVCHVNRRHSSQDQIQEQRRTCVVCPYHASFEWASDLNRQGDRHWPPV